MFKVTSFPPITKVGISLQNIPALQETADLIAFTEDILNGKLHFLCSVYGF